MISSFIALNRDGRDLAAGIQELFGGVLDYTLPVIGLVKGVRVAEHTAAATRGADFEDLWLRTSCVTTDMTSSTSAVHTDGHMDAALCASVAIPGVFPPVTVGQHLHADGGLLNNLPTDVVAATPGIGTVIGIDVAPSRGPVPQGGDEVSRSGWAALVRKATGRRQYPPITSVLIRSMLIASKDRQRASTTPVDLLLQPELRGVPMLDFSDVRGVAERGYRAVSTILYLQGLIDEAPEQPRGPEDRIIDLRNPSEADPSPALPPPPDSTDNYYRLAQPC